MVKCSVVNVMAVSYYTVFYSSVLALHNKLFLMPQTNLWKHPGQPLLGQIGRFSVIIGQRVRQSTSIGQIVRLSTSIEQIVRLLIRIGQIGRFSVIIWQGVRLSTSIGNIVRLSTSIGQTVRLLISIGHTGRFFVVQIFFCGNDKIQNSLVVGWTRV